MDNTVPSNRRDNLKQLRIALRMTQKDFLEQYYADSDGKMRISVATLSNLEARGGRKLDSLIADVSARLNLDQRVFDLPCEEFQEKTGKLSEEILRERAEEDHEEGKNDLFPSLEKKSNVSQIVSRLTAYFADQFYAGTLKKGDRIESDRELAVRLGVGRGAVREALKVLDVMGMLDIRPGQGTYIAEGTSDFLQIPLSWTMLLGGSQIRDIVEVRIFLQEKAAALAAACRDYQQLRKLDEIINEIHKTYLEHDVDKFLEADLRFHSCIAECSGNSMLYGLNETITSLVWRVNRTAMDSDERIKSIYEEHLKIYDLIRAGDAAGASTAMKEHLGRSRARYRFTE